MLEHIPAWMGRLIADMRAGHEKLAIVRAGVDAAIPMIDLTSPAFAPGARLPVRFTADGEGVSPPLVWGPLPDGARSLALIVEDPDAPAPNPLVHALIWNIPVDAGRIGEGDIAEDAAMSGCVGRNSYGARGWLPPDPPTGHGTHDYVFQLFALGVANELGDAPGRTEILDAMAGEIVGAGVLIGTYSRDEAEPVASGAPALPAA